MRPKLRDNKGKGPFELYPLGQFPNEIIYEIAKWMTYHSAVGRSDISGEDWGDIFARAIGGIHLGKPLGLADVTYKDMAWSVKSIKHINPHSANKIRVISGRCSPDFSYGITDPRNDITKTGECVLGIYNERINIAKNNYEPLRTCILIRNFEKMEFSLFEHDMTRFSANEYIWKVNKNGVFEGFHTLTNSHIFSWQPHGAQFTIIQDVPISTRKFKVRKPPVFNFENTISQIGFDANWVTIA